MYIAPIRFNELANKFESARAEAFSLQSKIPNLKIVSRSSFKFSEKYARDLIKSKKTSTIRYTPGAIELPSEPILPAYVVSCENDAGISEFASFEVLSVLYKKFDDLTEGDAIKDGFETLRDLKEELTTIYGRIDQEHLVTVFCVSVLCDTENTK